MKIEVLNVLCMYLPYGVKFKAGVDSSIYELEGINPHGYGSSEIQAIKDGVYHVDLKIKYDIKPYLRSLDTMTSEERQKMYELWDADCNSNKDDNEFKFMESRQLMFLLFNKFNFLLKKEDYIEAPEHMYLHLLT